MRWQVTWTRWIGQDISRYFKGKIVWTNSGQLTQAYSLAKCRLANLIFYRFRFLFFWGFRKFCEYFQQMLEVQSDFVKMHRGLSESQWKRRWERQYEEDSERGANEIKTYQKLINKRPSARNRFQTIAISAVFDCWMPVVPDKRPKRIDSKPINTASWFRQCVWRCQFEGAATGSHKQPQAGTSDLLAIKSLDSKHTVPQLAD